ncbi:MAG: SEC-C metal-binding domain-containing protein [Patescibacteria group bacterium]|jgi:hypothetical protein
MTKKIGRNDPCHCGSGKKYKKCHHDADNNPPTPEDFQAVKKYILDMQAEQSRLQAQGYFLPHVQSIFQGKRVRAVGSRLFHSLPIEQTFHEFLIDILAVTLGRAWIKDQLQLPSVQQHFITQCYIHFQAWKQKNATAQNSENKKWSAIPDGWSRSLLSLAFDIYCLQHRAKLPVRLLNRLKDQNQYQGARYEVAIASLFTQLGFTIEFLDRSKPQTRHCEFIATHQERGIRVAVEAKSRHRPGVIHTPGVMHEEQLIRGDVGRLIKSAMTQNPGDMPFMIFIDINCILTPGLNFPDKPWFMDIRNNVEELGEHDEKNPASENALYITNFSFHYQTDKEADPAEHVAIIERFTKHPLPDMEIYNLLHNGLTHYGQVPNLE